MKARILILILLFIPGALAISTDLKSTYQQGETIIIKISGNILEPIESSSVELKRGHVQVPFEYEIKKIEGNYYLSGIAPLSENNYTFIIKNVKTTLDGQVKEIDFNQNFSVISEKVLYSIKPGILVTSKDLEFTINLNSDDNEVVKIDFPEEHEYTLRPGQNKISLSTSGADPGFRVITIGAYAIPVLIIKKVEFKQETQKILPDFRFVPNLIESIVIAESVPEYPFFIINEGPTPIENIIFDFNDQIFDISPSPDLVLSAGDSQEFVLKIKKADLPISETLIAHSASGEVYLNVNITLTENEEEVKTPYLEDSFVETQSYYCSELNGKICTAGEMCSQETTKALDASNCCIGQCTTQTTSSKKGAIIGYSLGAVLLVILLVIFIRYRRTGVARPGKK